MPVIIPPGYANVSVEFWLDNYPRPAACTFGLEIEGGVGDPVAFANDVQAVWTDNFGANTDANVTVRDTRVTIGQDGTDPIVGISTVQTRGSVSSRESTAPALALMVTKNTTLGGRRNRGRFFIPWAIADQSVAENGAITPSTVSSWQGLATAFLADLESLDGSGGMVILHSTEGNPTFVNSLAVNPTIRTQRRRQVRY